MVESFDNPYTIAFDDFLFIYLLNSIHGMYRIKIGNKKKYRLLFVSFIYMISRKILKKKIFFFFIPLFH